MTEDSKSAVLGRDGCTTVFLVDPGCPASRAMLANLSEAEDIFLLSAGSPASTRQLLADLGADFRVLQLRRRGAQDAGVLSRYGIGLVPLRLIVDAQRRIVDMSVAQTVPSAAELREACDSGS
jgi:hypothetical protein